MPRTKPHTQLHKDGTVWARGRTLDGASHGYWEWYRKDGVIMRSGHFCQGEQCGAWTTYDKAGNVYKVTQIKGAVPASATKKAPAKAAPTVAQKKKAEPSVDELMASLDHPLKVEIALVRKAILSVDASITDGVTWNSLSFRTTEWFATTNLRSRDSLRLVLYLGVKPGKAAGKIEDPKGLLAWLGKDRAVATLGAGAQLKMRMPAFKAIVRDWIVAIRPDGGSTR